MPEKPIQPYVRFTQKVWESVKQNNPEHKVWEISKLISKMWREAADSERQIYFDEYDQGLMKPRNLFLIIFIFNFISMSLFICSCTCNIFQLK